MESFAIRPISVDEAARAIRASGHCAAGPRICQPLFPDVAPSESVFLEELADMMIREKKARQVTPDQALEILGNYPDNPLILSKVSGRYLEICRSLPGVCIYWKMRSKGMDV